MMIVFFMHILGNGDTSNDNTVRMGDGDEETNTGLPDEDTNYPNYVCFDPILSTSTGWGRGTHWILKLDFYLWF